MLSAPWPMLAISKLHCLGKLIMSVVLWLTVTVIAVVTGLSVLKGQYVQRLGRKWVAKFSAYLPNSNLSSAKQPNPEDPEDLQRSYAKCLEHQIELTKTLQRVMAKTSQQPGNRPTGRNKLQQCLSLRLQMLITELASLENLHDPDYPESQPNWKALQKGYGRILALHQHKFSTGNPLDVETDTTSPQPPKGHAAIEQTKVAIDLLAQVSHQHRLLSESDKRIKLLETKLEMAQRKISQLQWQVTLCEEQADKDAERRPMDLAAPSLLVRAK